MVVFYIQSLIKTDRW